MTLPRLCDGGTVVCIASGPSLTTEDVDYVRGKATVIAVNDAVLKASDPPVTEWKGYDGSTSWADVMLSIDQLWWERHYRQMRTFAGLKIRTHATMQKVTRGKVAARYCPGCQAVKPTDKPCWCEGIVTLFNAGVTGLSLELDTIVTTHNSGGAAINVSVLLGAKRVALLGYDMGPDDRGRAHFYDKGAVSVHSQYQTFRKRIASMVQPLKDAGVEVWNCSRSTHLECFPCRPLREVLV